MSLPALSARFSASVHVSAYAQPRTYSASCVSLGWFALWNSRTLAIPGTFSPNGTCGMTPVTPSAASRATAGSASLKPYGFDPNFVESPSAFAPLRTSETPVVVMLM